MSAGTIELEAGLLPALADATPRFHNAENLPRAARASLIKYGPLPNNAAQLEAATTGAD
jgi:hypothetical protein